MQNTYQSVRLTTQSVVKPCERNAAEEPSRGRVTSQVESSPIQPNPGHCMVRVVEVMFVPKQHQCKGQIVNCTHQTASTKLHPPNYIHQTTSLDCINSIESDQTATLLHPLQPASSPEVSHWSTAPLAIGHERRVPAFVRVPTTTTNNERRRRACLSRSTRHEPVHEKTSSSEGGTYRLT